MQLIDSHCHLQFDKLKSDIDGVIKRSKEANVSRMICVGTGLSDSYEAADFAAQFDNVWSTAGAHPHEAEDLLKTKDAALQLQTLLKKPKMVAAGEIGLDYYKDYSPRETQQKALRLQIDTALESGLPFIFHVRDAWADFWQIFDEYKGLKGVIHSFSSGTKQLNAALDRGLFIGLNGIMTFTKDQAQLDAAKKVPLDRLILETDAPFLTPAPNRNEICEPRHTAVTAKFLAELRNETVEILSKSTTENTERLFNLNG